MAGLRPTPAFQTKDQPRDEDTEGGTQSADKSLINRRLSSAPGPVQLQSSLLLTTKSRPNNHAFTLDREHKS